MMSTLILTTIFISSSSLRYNRPEAETQSYIERIPAAEDRFDLYVELRAWKSAMDIAAKLKDPHRLNEVASCG